MNQFGDNTDIITKLANFYGKWPGNYLKDLGYVPDMELQKQILTQATGGEDLDATLLKLGWIKQEKNDTLENHAQPIKRAGKKKVEKKEISEDLSWGDPKVVNDDPWHLK